MLFLSSLSAFTESANHPIICPSCSLGGAIRDRHESWDRLRWPRMVLLTRAPEADGEVVWSWLPDAGVKFLRSKLFGDDGGKKARSPGRARSKP